MYDPVIGRFISPDTYVQDPFNPQSLNRYSYCLNNLLRYTDPSGYWWLSDFWDWFRGVETIQPSENNLDETTQMSDDGIYTLPEVKVTAKRQSVFAYSTTDWDASTRQTIIRNWTIAGAGIGAIVGFVGGGGAGLLTGPGAPVAVPAGATAGAVEGSATGAAVGVAIGVANSLMVGQGNGNFEKMKQGDNTAQNKVAHDAFKQLKKDLGKDLTRAQQRQFHNYITKKGYKDFWDMYEAGLELFGP